MADDPKQDDPEQSKRFEDMAREVGVDETQGATDRAFERLSLTHSPKTRSAKKKDDSRLA